MFQCLVFFKLWDSTMTRVTLLTEPWEPATLPQNVPPREVKREAHAPHPSVSAVSVSRISLVFATKLSLFISCHFPHSWGPSDHYNKNMFNFLDFTMWCNLQVYNCWQTLVHDCDTRGKCFWWWLLPLCVKVCTREEDVLINLLPC